MAKAKTAPKKKAATKAAPKKAKKATVKKTAKLAKATAAKKSVKGKKGKLPEHVAVLPTSALHSGPAGFSRR